MAVLKMQRISICALKKDRKAILEKVQNLGVLEINFHGVDDDTFEKMDTAYQSSGFAKNATQAETALGVLDTYAPQKTSMLASLAGKDLVEEKDFLDVIARMGDITETANRIISAGKEITEQRAAVVKLENQVEALKPWVSLDIPMNSQGTLKSKVFIGTLPPESTAQTVYEAVENGIDIDVNVISTDKDALYLSIICLRKDESKVEEALRAVGFTRTSQLTHRTPADKIERLQQTIEKTEKHIAALEEKIRKEAENRTDLKRLSDYFRMRSAKYDVLGKLPQSKTTFVLSGYIPEKAVGLIESEIGNRFDCALDIEEISDDEDMPTVLENNGFSENYEGIVESYGLPQKGEFDPTTIMSFFYVFFFGLMLSDAAYGAILFLACFIIVKKYPRMSKGMQKSLKMFMYCGISTMVWGILLGGYFGDVVSVVARVFFHKENVSIPPVWFEPLKDPMKMLVFSMLFGVIHLFTGLGIKGYICLRDKKYLDFFCDCILWFVFLIGLLLMLLPSGIFRSMSNMNIVFPPAVNTLAKWLAIAGAAGIVLMSGRSSKNFGLRIALGAYDLYNVTGWLSDVLSYSRLLALGLATGVIASVINQMASMFGDSVLGVILFIAIFIFGQLFNLAINLLGAYVHTNRLQFVEFFGKFYEGGGRNFEPFVTNTKYIDVKEER
ncbi:MAG: V-type ATP synthase subunit I [Lachnospiraceae bacterium]|jgi:V/A-type H+-transporting ATPase subunit I|nr:V-type ATP synthase subunit I [Lachnospiraceae bacterium]